MTRQEIRDELQKAVDKNIHQVIAMLHNVGNDVVNKIRTRDISNWDDQTGNLRSSIGYIISMDGQPLEMSGFQQIDGPKRGTAEDPGYSPTDPISYAQSLVSLYPKGIALIVVAGMEYASYVEKMKNKTVLAQGELEAQTLISELITKLNAGK